MNYFDDEDDEDDDRIQEDSLDTSYSYSDAQQAGADDTSSSLPRPVESAPRYSDITSSTALPSSSSADVSCRRERSVSLSAILGDDSPFANTGERNIERLIRCLSNETGAPELLVFPKALVERIVKDLAKRRQLVKYASKASSADEGFYVTVALAATENMRASHVLKQFLRLRIFKIERYARILLKEYDEAMEVGDGARSPEEQDAVDRLYRPELAHARGYVQLTNEYFRDTALDQMPDIVKRKLDDVNTHPTPDLSTPVFVRARRLCPAIVSPKGEVLTFEKDSQHMIRYSSIRALLRVEYVELM